MYLLPKNLYSIVVQVFLVVLYVVNSICGRRFSEAGYYPGNSYYDTQEARYEKVNAALDKLEHAPQWASDWPDPTVKLGQVSGVALDNHGRVLVFHRASNSWGPNTFNAGNVYQNIGQPPIPHPTILIFQDSGELVDQWGENLFFMPHGITVDSADNVWVTDVALHQVFKFTPQNRVKPALTLGEKFVPGNDETHFCKPSAVAVLSSGEFFVADGYCNTRIIKYAPDGTKILEFGGRGGPTRPFSLLVPHALALAGARRDAVCVADREHGRAACFRADNGAFLASYRSWLAGQRLFGLAYAPLQGGRLYIVNGPLGGGVPVRGYVIDYTSGKLIQTFAPNGDFSNPHDIVVTPDGSKVYVAELDPHKVYKFIDHSLLNMTKAEMKTDASLAAVKPTATVEGAGPAAANESPRWAAWAGGAAAGVGLLGAAALVRARSAGRKGPRRRWEYGSRASASGGEFQLRRLLQRRRFARVHSDDSDDEPSPMLPPAHAVHAAHAAHADA